VHVTLRWAVITVSGRTLRFYEENRLKIALRLKAIGEKLLSATPAGSWHPHARRNVEVVFEDGRQVAGYFRDCLDWPAWEKTTLQEGPVKRPSGKRRVDA
jgi:hypothetical protein